MRSRSPWYTRRRRRRIRIAGQWYEKADFLALRKQWYSKLERKGFKDIEIIDWKTGRARECTAGISQADVCNTWTPEQERYYQLATAWTHVMRDRLRKYRAERLGLPRVVRPRDVAIWRLHAEGMPYRAISRRRNVSKGSVGAVVARERELMLSFDWDLWDGGDV